MTKEREALKLARGNICSAKLCEINSMSSRHEMIRLMNDAIAVIDQALAQPEQEPAEWMNDVYEESRKNYKLETSRVAFQAGAIFARRLIYTTPPQRKPLTDEEIAKTWDELIKYAPGDIRLKEFARAIEAAHGITGEQHG